MMPYDRLILSDSESRPVRIVLTSRQTTVDLPVDFDSPSLFSMPGRAEGKGNPAQGRGDDEGPVTPEQYPDALEDAIDDMIDRDSDGYGFPPEEYDDEEENEEENRDAREALYGLIEQLESLIRGEDEYTDDDLVMQFSGQMEKKTLGDGSMDLTVSWEEMMPVEGTSTVLALNSHQPGVVTLSRFGPVSSMIVCEEGVRHTTAYRTPWAAMELAVLGRRCESTVTYARGGVIEMDYLVEIRGTDLQYTKLKIEITPAV